MLVKHLLAAASTGAVVVHHDRKSGPLELSVSDDRLRVLGGAIDVWWAHWSQVKAITLMLKELAGRDDLSWVVLLTGEDWPAQPLEVVASELVSSGCEALLQSVPVSQRWDSWQVALRYEHRWWRLPPGSQKVTVPLAQAISRVKGFQYLENYGRSRIAMFGVRRARPSAHALFGGIEYFAVTPRVARALVSASNSGPLRRRLKRSLVPTEAFFATAVKVAGFKVGPPRRYMQFIDGQANPELLTAADVIEAGRQGYLFARKVPGTAVQELLGRETAPN